MLKQQMVKYISYQSDNLIQTNMDSIFMKRFQIEDFYVKQNDSLVYPDSNTATQLYAASRGLTKLLSFPYGSVR